MKILVISDTHGKLDMVRDIWTKLKDVDLIAHAGDHYMDAIRLRDEFRTPVIAVAGNCDRSFSYSGSGAPSGTAAAFNGVISLSGQDYTYTSLGDHGIIETEAGRIYLAHGHRQHVNYDLNSLRYSALEEGCSMAIFGHTHRSFNEEVDGIRFLNPGSLPLPRDGSGGSYAIVRTSLERMDAAVVYYNTVMGLSIGHKGGSGVEGHGGHGGAGAGEKSGSSDAGVLRSLFSYSDRF